MMSGDNIGGKLTNTPALPAPAAIADDPRRKPSLAIVAELTAAVAQLRRAYIQLGEGGQKELADGLILPPISCINKIIRRLA